MIRAGAGRIKRFRSSRFVAYIGAAGFPRGRFIQLFISVRHRNCAGAQD
jgi:hypothetical protein